MGSYTSARYGDRRSERPRLAVTFFAFRHAVVRRIDLVAVFAENAEMDSGANLYRGVFCPIMKLPIALPPLQSLVLECNRIMSDGC